ncbi:phosphoribosylglycinamide formyltransferase [Sulfurovum sp. zt1-1]|uniref:Phosphoribosylglycinamide formyltransferase n=1 Tax=Sulfurovum zhangzhouensis TaxID=3019067 RepID=A0ABT7QZR6_9BACT|nr:phosphoribosylglycinamide formyltransferase [Sulfurovum zhangzhouensis]MDM5272342.1 phosphoribosylglycinamide formyltransferase [Sulfurovum zhangzhouensis]
MRSMKRIAVLFSGTGSNFAHIINTLHKQEVEIAVALTNNPEAGGIQLAKEHGIPLEIIDSKAYDSREAFDSAVIERLRPYGADLTVLAGFMRILTPVFTDQIKCINLHPSLLPRHKGLKSIERSYEDEYPTGGVSVHWVTSELDGGEIILQKEVAKEGLSFEEYDEKVRAIEKVALEEAIRKALD